MLSKKSLLNKHRFRNSYPKTIDDTLLLNHAGNSAAGFTIIEVIIVLAIAGLILTIIFIAVPYLKILQRNSARAQDAARLTSSITTFISTNGNVQPGMEGGTENETDWATNDCPSIAATAGRLAEFGTNGDISGMCTSNASQATTNNGFVMYKLTPANSQVGLGHNYGSNWLVYITGAVCPSGQGTILTIPAGNFQQSILIYPWEQFNQPDDLHCTQVT